MTASKTIWRVTGIFGLLAIAVLWFVNPEHAWWAPKCPVHYLTGLQCPGCGVSRAIHALLHGHAAEALAYNLFFIISIPYLLSVCAVMYIPALHRRERLRLFVTGSVPAWTYLILFCVWFVVRNIFGI